MAQLILCAFLWKAEQIGPTAALNGGGGRAASRLIADASSPAAAWAAPSSSARSSAPCPSWLSWSSWSPNWCPANSAAARRTAAVTACSSPAATAASDTSWPDVWTRRDSWSLLAVCFQMATVPRASPSRAPATWRCWNWTWPATPTWSGREGRSWRTFRRKVRFSRLWEVARKDSKQGTFEGFCRPGQVMWCSVPCRSWVRPVGSREQCWNNAVGRDRMEHHQGFLPHGGHQPVWFHQNHDRVSATSPSQQRWVQMG